MFLKEPHSKKETEVQWENEWGGEILFSHGSPNSCGRAILIRNNTNYSVLSTTRDPLGRFIILKIQIDDKVYVLVNIYAPNKDKDLIQFFRKLHGLLQMEDLDSEENIILGGDFNCPLNPALDKHGRGCLKNNQYLVLKGVSVYGKVALIKSLLIPKSKLK